MPSKDSIVVRLPERLLARVDALRGKKSRAAFLELVIDTHEHGQPATPSNGAGRPAKASTAGAPRTPEQQAVARKRRRAGSNCLHPITRRIGDMCAECGNHVP